MRNSKYHPFKEFKLLGKLVNKYWLFYTILLSVVSAISVFFVVRAFMVPSYFDEPDFNRHLAYVILYGFLAILSAAMIPFLVFSKKGKVSDLTLSVLLHAYCVILILWGTVFGAFSMAADDELIAYYTVIIVVGGIIAIDPAVYLGAVVSSMAVLIVIDANNGFPYFNTAAAFIDCFVFLAMALFMAYKNYYLIIRNERMMDILINFSRRDSLTGLGNETAYYEKIKELQNNIDGGDDKFAVAVLDVNNIKATNDKYGHRFGCHLIVTAGKTLPDIFPSSHCYHIGGDEFVVIIEGKDFESKEKLLGEFSSRLEFGHIVYEGIELILSVAIGVSNAFGDSYNAIYQAADDNMYKNKKEIKAKHGIAER